MAADTRRTIASRFQGYWNSYQGVEARSIRNYGGLTMALFLIIGAFLLSIAAAFAWICDERIIAGIYGAMAFACVFGLL